MPQKEPSSVLSTSFLSDPPKPEDPYFEAPASVLKPTTIRGLNDSHYYFGVFGARTREAQARVTYLLDGSYSVLRDPSVSYVIHRGPCITACQQPASTSEQSPRIARSLPFNVGALIIRISFWGPVCYNYIKGPQQFNLVLVSNCLGPYITSSTSIS